MKRLNCVGFHIHKIKHDHVENALVHKKREFSQNLLLCTILEPKIKGIQYEGLFWNFLYVSLRCKRNEWWTLKGICLRKKVTQRGEKDKRKENIYSTYYIYRLNKHHAVILSICHDVYQFELAKRCTENRQYESHLTRTKPNR